MVLVRATVAIFVLYSVHTLRQRLPQARLSPGAGCLHTGSLVGEEAAGCWRRWPGQHTPAVSREGGRREGGGREGGGEGGREGGEGGEGGRGRRSTNSTLTCELVTE